MTNIAFNSANYAIQPEKDRAINSSKDNKSDDIVHLNENGQFDRADLEGALKSGKESLLVKGSDGNVYTVNVKEEMGKLNDALKTNPDGSADDIKLSFTVCKTVTKTEVKDIDPIDSKFSFSLKDGKNTLREIKKMDINLKDGMNDNEVKSLINQLKSEGATPKEIQNVLDQVNDSRKMRKNDQTLSVQEDDNSIKYQVEDNSVKTKKGPIKKTQDGNFDVTLPGVEVDGKFKITKEGKFDINKEGKFAITKERDGKFDVGLGLKIETGKKTLFSKSAEEVKAGIKLSDGEKTKSDLKKLGINFKNGISQSEYNVIVDKLKSENPNITNSEINDFFKNIDKNGVRNRITVETATLKTDCGEETKTVVGGLDGDDIPETKTRKGINIPTIKITADPHADIKLPKYNLETPKIDIERPKFGLETPTIKGKPGDIDISFPKFSRDKNTNYDKGFEGTIDKKQTTTTTEEVCEDITTITPKLEATPVPEKVDAGDFYKSGKFGADKNNLINKINNEKDPVTKEALQAQLKDFEDLAASLPDNILSGESINLDEYMNLVGNGKAKDAASGDKESQTQKLQRSTTGIPDDKGIIQIQSTTDGDATGIWKGQNNDFHDFYKLETGSNLKASIKSLNIMKDDYRDNNDLLSALRSASFAKALVIEKAASKGQTLTPEQLNNMSVTVTVKDKTGKEVELNIKLGDIPPGSVNK